MLINLKIGHTQIQGIFVLAHGSLGEALHTIALYLFQQGPLQLLRSVEAVRFGGRMLSAKDEVRSDGIWRNEELVVRANRPPPTIVIDCSWHDMNIGRSHHGLQVALVERSRAPSNLGLIHRYIPKPQDILPPKVNAAHDLTFHQAGHQSGDRYCIALTLRLIPNLRLQIHWDDTYFPHHYKQNDLETREKMLHNAQGLANFYIGCGVEHGRIDVVYSENAEKTVRSKRDVNLVTSDATRIVGSAIERMGYATFCGHIAIPTFTETVTATRRQCVQRLMLDIFEHCLDDDRPVVAFFLRNTGHRPGGAHPELDTHGPMFRQLIRYLQSQPDAPHIALVGDTVFRPYSPERHGSHHWKRGLVNMMQWWDKVVGTGEKRLTLNEQLFGILYLHHLLGDRLTLMGMRSGMLEAPALMGIRVIYIDYVFPGKSGIVGSSGFERMLVLAGRPEGDTYGLDDEQGFQGVNVPNYSMVAVHPVCMHSFETMRSIDLDLLDGISWQGGMHKHPSSVSPLQMEKDLQKTLLLERLLRVLRTTSDEPKDQYHNASKIAASLFCSTKVQDITKLRMKSPDSVCQYVGTLSGVRIDNEDAYQLLLAYVTMELGNRRMAIPLTQLMDIWALIRRETPTLPRLTASTAGRTPELIMQRRF